MNGPMLTDEERAWRRRYEAYLSSARWRNLRRDLIRIRGNRCERCGERASSARHRRRGGYGLEVHHKTYERLGRERLSDLEVLCAPCHRKADREREAAAQRRRTRARYLAALHTYAEKKYGEDWQFRRDEAAVAAEFDRWIERHTRNDARAS